MTKRLLLIACAIGINAMAFAQTQVFDNVRNFELRNSGNIMEQDAIAGYYFFFKKDKVDRKTESFKITLLDNNLNTVKVFDVERPERTELVETVFNGSAFLMSYYKKGDLDLVTYDKTGKKLGSKKLEDIPSWEKQRLATVEEGGSVNKSIYPLSDSAFVRQTIVKNDKYGFELEAYSNAMKTLWKYGSPESSDQIESVDILYSSPAYIGACVSRKKSQMSKSMDQSLLLLDARTGKKVFERALKESGSELSLLNLFVDEEKQRCVLLGEYYAPGDEIMNSKSLGLYSAIADMSGGKATVKKYSWAKDLAKALKDMTDNSKTKTPPSICFHKVYRSKTGKAIAIGEQYRKQASAGGIASMVLSGGRSGVSTAEMKVMDMIVMEFDSSNNITNAFNVPKKATTVNLPSGAEFSSPALLANFIKVYGGFDYEFSSIDRKRDRMYSVYKDYNKRVDDSKKSEKADAMVGVISYEDGKSKTDRIPLNTDANLMWLSPGKPGFMVVGEYFKKKKQISYRLEKISY